MATLLLRLGGPLQSWGSSSVYDQRDTDDMPTKSAVIGLLAGALGRKRDESVEDLAALNFGVRVDLPGSRLKDFQVTNMGEKLNANLSNRVYLTDAVFLVGLESDDEEFLSEIDHAVNNPEYPLFMGRRSCPPTLPLNLGIRPGELYETLLEEPWLVPEWRQKELFGFREEIRLRIVTDSMEDHGAFKRDVPISFSPFKREYRYRYLKEMAPKTVKKEEILYGTEHDPMKELE